MRCSSPKRRKTTSKTCKSRRRLAAEKLPSIGTPARPLLVFNLPPTPLPHHLPPNLPLSLHDQAPIMEETRHLQMRGLLVLPVLVPNPVQPLNQQLMVPLQLPLQGLCFATQLVRPNKRILWFSVFRSKRRCAMRQASKSTRSQQSLQIR